MLGKLAFEKRCTCKEIEEVLQSNPGASATLKLDGFDFVMVGGE